MWPCWEKDFAALACNVIQDKSYSRDWLVRGRLRVQLKDDAGKPLVADIPTRKLWL